MESGKNNDNLHRLQWVFNLANDADGKVGSSELTTPVQTP